LIASSPPSFRPLAEPPLDAADCRQSRHQILRPYFACHFLRLYFFDLASIFGFACFADAAERFLDYFRRRFSPTPPDIFRPSLHFFVSPHVS